MRSRSHHILPWLAGALAGLGTGLYVVFVVLAFRIERVPTSAFDTGVPLDELPFMTSNLFTILVGAFLSARRPYHPIGWLLLLLGYGFLTFQVIVVLLAFFTRSSVEATTGLVLLAWVANWVWALSFVGLLYTFLLFPSGQPLSPFWRVVSWAAAPVLSVVVLGSALHPGPMDVAPQWNNPFGVEIFAYLLEPMIVGMLIFELLSIMALIVRFARSQGIERQQLKWVAFGVAVFGLVNGISIASSALGNESMLIERAIRWLVGAAPMAVEAAIVTAILRYRLYDIDVIIRHTLVYSLLTLTLGLVYLGCILVSRALVAPLTGGSELAIVASTLAIAALFNPLRRRIQAIIDKRFYRRRYDAAKVLAAFGATVRDETDLDALTAELLHLVDETMQPEFVGLWLKPVDGVKREA